MTRHFDRRSFVRASAAAGLSLWLPESRRASARGYPANQKLDIAVIGVGGKGHSDTLGVASENIVALCDVDARRGAATFRKFPNAKVYEDYRVLFDRERKLDAVVIATPDHSHAPPAVRAIQRGLHVYCQKPLTHTVEEARLLRELASKHRVATSMGNHGTAYDGFREAVEVVRSGAIGAVREVHVWTDRPGGWWKQGIDRPATIEPIPATLRFDLFLGPAPYRPYHSGYTPFAWRGFWDFGTGALGDMGCHLLNLPYMALSLGVPESVAAESEGATAESPPKWSKVVYRFPARGALPPVVLTWYDGGKRPPTELVPGVAKLRAGGAILVGDKGVLYSPHDYGAVYKLLPEERYADFRPPTQTLPRGPGSVQGAKIYLEWLAHCKGGAPCMANFDYAGPLTETVLLGNVALRSGQTVRFDAAKLRATGSVAADRLLRKDYRWGFEARRGRRV
ncbi:MAG: Gfo/Idh/MocA family oxidoreductase [Planctomycetes bacterium]|nr:Gfo/Idh/MocA family oxidoreductase [Planctomycetota bacterium]MCB9868402.1 Gfo/Idh/MocA family oxidoreductase [Planctomycetota bacterium]